MVCYAYYMIVIAFVISTQYLPHTFSTQNPRQYHVAAVVGFVVGGGGRVSDAR